LDSIIWVVDNGSTDGSLEIISRECPSVRLICNSSNLGFAGGNNRGVKEALAISDAPILLLNNDAFVAEKDIIRLLKTLESDEKIGFVGPLLFETDDGERLLAAGGRDPVLHHQSHILEVTPGKPIREVEYVPGTVLLGRPKAFRTLGPLDERYFFTMEVADLCMRARRRGYLSVIDVRAKAFHALSRSSDLRETLHTYYIVRNRFLFIRKFHTDHKTLFYSFWTLYSLALILKVWLAGKIATAKAVWAGLLDGLRGRFGGQNERVLRLCGQSSSSRPRV
jgi:hypothetical protein